MGTETSEDGVPLHVDLLRADLYRLLDAMVRASPEERDEVIRAFEQGWERLKELTAPR